MERSPKLPYQKLDQEKKQIEDLGTAIGGGR